MCPLPWSRSNGSAWVIHSYRGHHELGFLPANPQLILFDAMRCRSKYLVAGCTLLHGAMTRRL